MSGSGSGSYEDPCAEDVWCGELPPYRIHYEGTADDGGCMVNTQRFTIKDQIRLQRVGALYQGAAGRLAPADTRLHRLMHASPSPKNTWVCMRDWSDEDQRLCGLARGELGCFGLGTQRNFHYGGSNGHTGLVPAEAERRGRQLYAMSGVTGSPRVQPPSALAGLPDWDDLDLLFADCNIDPCLEDPVCCGDERCLRCLSDNSAPGCPGYVDPCAANPCACNPSAPGCQT